MKQTNLTERITFRTTKEKRTMLEKTAKSKKLSLSELITSSCFTENLNITQRQALTESLIHITNELNKIPSEYYSKTLAKEVEALWQSLI